MSTSILPADDFRRLLALNGTTTRHGNLCVNHYVGIGADHLRHCGTDPHGHDLYWCVEPSVERGKSSSLLTPSDHGRYVPTAVMDRICADLAAKVGLKAKVVSNVWSGASFLDDYNYICVYADRE